nr:MAG TPA: hypothetical protein [Caudoviricetes sp.]
MPLLLFVCRNRDSLYFRYLLEKEMGDAARYTDLLSQA